jgi:DNA ligase-1
MLLQKLFKLTSTGDIQEWGMELEGNRYRTISGRLHGTPVTSTWVEVTEGKNLGKANETTPEEQAKLEVEAIYRKKQEQGKYATSIADIDDARESYFSPMLAEKFDPDRLHGAFYIQPKLNGVRCIADRHGLWSRKGKQFINCPHIEENLRAFFVMHPDARLDGELYNHAYKTDFEALVSAIKKQKPDDETRKLAADVVQYHLYDMPCLEEFSARWALLQHHFSKLPITDAIQLTHTVRSSDIKTAQALHERNKANGYEGSIVRLDKVYETKRTYSLMKYKDMQDAEFEIVDVLEGKGNWSGAAKSVTCKLNTPATNNKETFEAGIKGDYIAGAAMLANKANYIGKQATIVFQNYSKYGVPIFPIFVSVRDYE